MTGSPSVPGGREGAVDGSGGFTALMAQADTGEDFNWAVLVESTIVRSHQHAAGARTKGPRPTRPDTVLADKA
ncbi:hypothetical protein ACFWZ2_40030 [Streptomyces sp. NPDC059002]|uniref:hypothetical protein n=1 Tax=Streptomyces sp. NPDC059002 TaxID=3346690 RepID=UPI0036899230